MGQQMDFGMATQMAREGKKISRAGWNGKNMYLMYADGGTWKDAEGTVQGDLDPFLVMFTAGGTFVPWLASQTDVLARDWGVVN